MVIGNGAASEAGGLNFLLLILRAHHPGTTSRGISLAKEFPIWKIILAHAGALFPIDHPTPPNIYYDLAACPLLYDAHIYQN